MSVGDAAVAITTVELHDQHRRAQPGGARPPQRALAGGGVPARTVDRIRGPVVAPTAGILLTGGRSRRMGVDKATLVLDGETLAAARRPAPRPRCATPCSRWATAGAVCRSSASRRPAPDRSRRWPPPASPCATAATTARRCSSRSTSRRSTRRCCAGCATVRANPPRCPRVDGRLQPVCARYGADALVAAESLVAGVSGPSTTSSTWSSTT